MPRATSCSPTSWREPVGEADTTATATYTDAGRTHLLLRFSSYIATSAPGPLEVTGVNPVNRRIPGDGLHQVITHDHDDGVSRARQTEALFRARELRYEETDGHNHWHFQNAARYSLWNDDEDRSEVDAFSSKVGFCFLDIGTRRPELQPGPATTRINFQYSGPWRPNPTPFGSSTNNCLAHLPSFPDPTDAVVPQRTKVDMGISTGWRDVYERTLPFQYVDVSDLHARLLLDQVRGGPEQPDAASPNETNAAGVLDGQATVVPGYIARRPVNAGPDQRREGVDVQDHAVASTKFAQPAPDPAIGAVQYKITEQPEHGTLTPRPARADAGRLVRRRARCVYTKDGAYNGPDTSSSPPSRPAASSRCSPASAPVTMQVGSGNGRHGRRHQRRAGLGSTPRPASS